MQPVLEFVDIKDVHQNKSQKQARRQLHENFRADPTSQAKIVSHLKSRVKSQTIESKKDQLIKWSRRKSIGHIAAILTATPVRALGWAFGELRAWTPSVQARAQSSVRLRVLASDGPNSTSVWRWGFDL